MSIQAPPDNSPWAVVFQTQASRMVGMQQLAHNIYWLAYSIMENNGHCPFGAGQLKRELERALGRSVATGSIDRSIRDLEVAGILAEQSNQKCLVFYADFAQRSVGRAKPKCTHHSLDSERTWRDGHAPVVAPKPKTVTLPPEHEIAALVNIATGELIDTPETSQVPFSHLGGAATAV